MNTPKSKPLSIVKSKYLTPCRTTGLKRKSTSPLSQLSSSGLNVLSRKATPSPLSIPKKQRSWDDTKNTDIPQSPTVPKPAEEIKNIENILGNSDSEEVVGVTEPTEENGKPFYGFINKEDAIDLINDINNKMDELNRLKLTHVYTRKHNLRELKDTTNIWRDAVKKAVLALQEELHSRGREVSLAVILKEHGITFEEISFNEETMDFE